MEKDIDQIINNTNTNIYPYTQNIYLTSFTLLFLSIFISMLNDFFIVKYFRPNS